MKGEDTSKVTGDGHTLAKVTNLQDGLEKSTRNKFKIQEESRPSNPPWQEIRERERERERERLKGREREREHDKKREN